MKITNHEDLEVYKIAFESAMSIFNLTLTFPKEEKYSLTDQIRRSSRSVCANIAEAFYRRKYPKNFSSHLSDSIAEAAETRVWVNFAFACNYLSEESTETLLNEYSRIIGKLIVMYNQSEKWCI
ncbi:MAG: four helix bundle protein [Bacteroidales bacterium]|nr:four helix bundle protein [Bacteroidales bacterium]